eukprot:scaffold184449_cov21-Tisochrysis_lutea.AAC.2
MSYTVGSKGATQTQLPNVSARIFTQVNVEEGEDGAPSGSSKSRTRSRRPTATNIVISEVPFQTSK